MTMRVPTMPVPDPKGLDFQRHSPLPRGEGPPSPCASLLRGCEQSVGVGGWGGALGAFPVHSGFCWGVGQVGSKRSVPLFPAPGDQATACTRALWWLKFGPGAGG